MPESNLQKGYLSSTEMKNVARVRSSIFNLSIEMEKKNALVKNKIAKSVPHNQRHVHVRIVTF